MLGHDTTPSDRVRDARRTHIMAWNRPDGGSEAPMSANLTPRTPPSVRLYTDDQAREASFVVSPLRKDNTGVSEASAPGTLGSGAYKG